jgi:hypothetical protein
VIDRGVSGSPSGAICLGGRAGSRWFLASMSSSSCFPAVFGVFVLGRLASGIWLLLYAALGYALWRGRTVGRS